VGDDPHISIVTFTTDVEDGVDYQGGGPSARRWERERQLLLGLRTPGPSSRRATETPPQSGYPWIVGSVVAVLVAVSHQVRGTESRSAWVRAGTLRKSSVRRLALTLGTPSVFGRAETNSGGPGGEGRVVRLSSPGTPRTGRVQALTSFRPGDPCRSAGPSNVREQAPRVEGSWDRLGDAVRRVGDGDVGVRHLSDLTALARWAREPARTRWRQRQ
jgi:hypothetical protein